MTDAELQKKVANRIKELRIQRGMSQLEFAVALDYEKSNTSRLESGKVNPRITTLYKVASVLEISLQELLTIE